MSAPRILKVFTPDRAIQAAHQWADLLAAYLDRTASNIVDEKAKVSSADTTSGYLNTKITVGSHLSKSITSPAGDERLELAATNVAPADAQYLVLALNSELTAEMKWTPETDDFRVPSYSANGDYTFALKRARDRFYRYSDMWNSGEIEWISAETSGAASSVTDAIVISGHPGVVTANTGTNPTGGRAGMGSNTLTKYRVGDCEWTLECVLMLNQLSDSTNSFWAYFGLTTFATTPANGVVFRYKHDNNSGKWQLTALNASTPTSQDSGITVAASTWYRLTLVINAAGSAVEGFVNGSSIGSVSSGLPATSTSLGIHLFLANTAGSGGYTAEFDYMEQCGVFSASR